MSHELLIPGCNTVWLTRNSGCPAVNAVALGFQPNAGPLYSAVADTPVGRIPGKAKDNTCWYSLNGREECTDQFWWVCSPSKVSSYRGNFPKNPITGGYQHDGTGIYYLVVADTPYGTIPGKIRPGSNQCSYAYGGREETSSQFSYVVLK
ncbi:uncharacterized protein LOC141913287 [Tubulanus polymorphus]|uniref:uncharacterized protein LOC141913287 n=1 Tax=Tubulanus polymorphus TaxID=672921 RepID=UPI003DA2228E